MASVFQRIKFDVVGTVALAFAAGVCVISAACALYAALHDSLGPAGAAGLTALAAAIVAAILGVLVVRLRPGGAKPKAVEARRLDPETLQSMVGVGMALAGGVADMMIQHRLERKHVKHDKHGRKRR